MVIYLKIVAVMMGLAFGLALAFQLYLEWDGVLARAAYAHGVSFTGLSHFGRATYAGINWFQDIENPFPCPLTIHLPEGDLAGTDLASAPSLLARGFTPDLPNAQTTALLTKLAGNVGEPYQPLPPHYVRWLGRVQISIGIDPDGPNAGLMSVYIGYMMVEPRPWPRVEGIVSVLGRPVAVPATNRELDLILGPPLEVRQGWP
jgi:hypothetical protein